MLGREKEKLLTAADSNALITEVCTLRILADGASNSVVYLPRCPSEAPCPHISQGTDSETVSQSFQTLAKVKIQIYESYYVLLSNKNRIITMFIQHLTKTTRCSH